MNLKRLCGIVAGGMMLAQPASAQDFDRAGWFADLDQMRDVMTSDYANLEWAAAERQSLKSAYALARSEIEASGDESAAREALVDFAASFGDGHLHVRWPAAAPPSSSDAAPSPCTRLATGRADREGALQGLPGYEPISTPDSATLPAGFVTVGGRRFGVLRIPVFGQFAFPEICNGIAAERQIGPDCDEACMKDLETASHAGFMAIATRQVRALADGRPDALIVDLARNGGGDDSSEAIARMLTRRPLRSAPIGMLRTPAWTARLDSDIAELTALLPSLNSADRVIVDGILARMRAAREETSRPCDRSPMWRDEPIACSQIVATTLSATGWVNAFNADEVRGRPWAEWTFSLAPYPYEAGLWDGPLYVVVDQGTASSAEQFTAVLRDAGAATIIGTPTFGAGCGHWLNSDPVALNHSGGQFSMPDCTRYRADGANEVGGIVPDILIPIRGRDSRRQRTERMRVALGALPSAANP
jgi:Peptidase family S41